MTRVALENAVSIASLMLTTEAAVGEIPEKGATIPQHAPGMDMMGGF